MVDTRLTTLDALLTQYQTAVVPADLVCRDYFRHLKPDQFVRKINEGKIDLPLVRIEASQKAAVGVHIADLAKHIDARRAAAVKENDQIHGRTPGSHAARNR